tara:strand:- start:723 stop:2579 length:1857 start_codon:yes stop_codon:yes gene_type:complete
LNLFGQEKQIDTFLKAIETSKTKEFKVDAIIKLGNYWFERNYDSATYYYKKANDISNSINYKKGKFDYATNLGNVYLFQGNYKELKKLMEESIIKAKGYNDTHYEAMFTTNLGNAYMYNAEYEKALLYFQKGIDLFNKNKEYKYERKINIYISICFLNSNNLDKSIDYSKLSLEQSEKAKDSIDICEALEYIGNGYVEKNEFNIAKPFLERQLKLAQDHNLPDKIANSQYLLSRVFQSEKNSPKAIELLESALTYYSETGNVFYKINVLTQLSIYYKDLKNYQKSLVYIKEAEQLAESNQMKSHLLLVYTNMAFLNNDMHNYKDAYKYLEKHDVLNDSLNSIELKNKLQDLDVKYETSKKELLIKNLTQQNAIKTLQSKRRFWISVALGLVVVSLLLFAYTQFKNFKTKKTLLAAQQKNAIIEERLRIASDMHDDVGSGLSRIRYIIGAISSSNTEQTAGIAKTTEIIDDSIQKMKEIVWSLNESNQNLEELIYYIRGQMSEMTENAKINFKSCLPESIPTLFFGWARNRNTYLLVKETINNAIKHANATKIALDFEIGKEFIITISDNGKGFDTNKKYPGNGLNNYKKRILELNGRYDLKSEINKGTTVTFYVPFTS